MTKGAETVSDWDAQIEEKALNIVIASLMSVGKRSGIDFIDRRRVSVNGNAMKVFPPRSRENIVALFGGDDEVVTIALKEFLKRESSLLMRAIDSDVLQPLTLYRWDRGRSEATANYEEIARRSGHAVAEIEALAERPIWQVQEFQRLIQGKLSKLDPAEARLALAKMSGDIRLFAVGHGQDVNGSSGGAEYRVFAKIAATTLSHYLNAVLFKALNFKQVDEIYINFVCCALITPEEQLKYQSSYIYKFLADLSDRHDKDCGEHCRVRFRASGTPYKLGYFPEDFIKLRMLPLGGEEYVYEKKEMKRAGWRNKLQLEVPVRSRTPSDVSDPADETKWTDAELAHMRPFSRAQKELAARGGMKSEALKGERDLLFCLARKDAYRVSDPGDAALLWNFVKEVGDGRGGKRFALPAGVSDKDAVREVNVDADTQNQTGIAVFRWFDKPDELSTEVNFAALGFTVGRALQKLHYANAYLSELSDTQKEALKRHHLRTRKIESKVFCWVRPNETFDEVFVDRFLSIASDKAIDAETLKTLRDLAGQPTIELGRSIEDMLAAALPEGGSSARGERQALHSAKAIRREGRWDIVIGEQQHRLSESESAIFSRGLTTLLTRAYATMKTALEEVNDIQGELLEKALEMELSGEAECAAPGLTLVSDASVPARVAAGGGDLPDQELAACVENVIALRGRGDASVDKKAIASVDDVAPTVQFINQWRAVAAGAEEENAQAQNLSPKPRQCHDRRQGQRRDQAHDSATYRLAP